MSSPEAFNFGRRIKDLKRTYNKTYADLTAGLKISRERIVQLEENEREPTEIERKRFADFYALPPEDLGLFAGGPGPAPRPTGSYSPPPGNDRPSYSPPPAYNDRPSPSYGGDRGNFGPPAERGNFGPPAERGNYGPPAERGNFGPPAERGNYSGPPAERGNFGPPSGGDRRGGYEQRGNYDGPGNFNDRPPRGPSNFNDRPPRGPSNFNDRPPRGPGNFNDRPPRGPGGFNDRPPQRPTGAGRPQDEADRPPRPPKPPKPKAVNTGEPKPVMKYTAEQLGDIESAYLRKQRDLKVPLKFTFMNGKEYTGVVVDFTPFTVHIIEQSTGEEVILRKLAMAYYRKADAIEEARASAGKPEEV